jgi:hypothetical protein
MIAAGLGLTLAACSGRDETSEAPVERSTEAVTAPVSEVSETAPAGGVTDPTILTLAGLGRLRIGEPVPADSGWSKSEVQLSDECVTFGSNDQSNAYAMSDGKVIARITVSAGSGVKTQKGIGIDASDAEVRAAYPGIVAEPHKYIDAPGRYLTWIPQADGPGLRFEIGTDGKVSMIHAGLMPWLGYVEGCA